MKSTTRVLITSLFFAIRITAAEMENPKNDPPLIQAIQQNTSLEHVQFLVEHKADVNERGKNCWTALMWASYKNKLDVVRYLISENANATFVNYNGKSAVNLTDHEDIIRLLLQHGGVAEKNLNSSLLN